MKFSYRATDARGDLQRGNLTADTETAARQIVEAKGWVVVEIRTQGDSPPLAAPPPLPALLAESPKASEWPKIPAAVIGLLLLIPIGLAAFWPKSSGSAPNQASTPAVKQASKSITVQGVMPLEPVDFIHITCMGAAIQIDREPAAKPGQPFSCLVEVPQESGDILIEVSRSRHRWAVGTIHPQDSPNLTLPSIQVPQLMANNSKPYQSHFASAKNSKLPTQEETRRNFEDRQRQEAEIRRQHHLSARRPQ